MGMKRGRRRQPAGPRARLHYLPQLPTSRGAISRATIFSRERAEFPADTSRPALAPVYIGVHVPHAGNLIHASKPTSAALSWGSLKVVRFGRGGPPRARQLLIEDVRAWARPRWPPRSPVHRGQLPAHQFTSICCRPNVIGVSIWEDRPRASCLQAGPLFTNNRAGRRDQPNHPRHSRACSKAMNEAQVSLDHSTYPIRGLNVHGATGQNRASTRARTPAESQLDRSPAHPHRLSRRIGRESVRAARARPRWRRWWSSIGRRMAFQEQADACRPTNRCSTTSWRWSPPPGPLAAVTGVSPRGCSRSCAAARAQALADGREFLVPTTSRASPSPLAHRVMVKGRGEQGEAGRRGVLRSMSRTSSSRAEQPHRVMKYPDVSAATRRQRRGGGGRSGRAAQLRRAMVGGACSWSSAGVAAINTRQQSPLPARLALLTSSCLGVTVGAVDAGAAPRAACPRRSSRGARALRRRARQRKRWLTSYSVTLELLTAARPRFIYIPRLEAERDRLPDVEETLPARGRQRLAGVRLTTRFPFALFLKASRVMLARKSSSPAVHRSRPRRSSSRGRRHFAGDSGGRGHDLYISHVSAGETPAHHLAVRAPRWIALVREMEAETTEDTRIVLRGRRADATSSRRPL